ncbi:MAG TPA: glucose-1-phosphate thymidylyltransferase [Thermoplasmata archaeon]|nr:glucose-1-phosphate thymidylyltransferase [Thermoplasmata archaeon]
MKGLLLAGGHGTRLRPLTFTGNKHMLPIANRPLLFYGLEHLRRAGVEDVGIVLGPIREGIQERVGDGSLFGVKVQYIEQGEPRGLAHAVRCARDFLGDDPFLMYLGDNMLEHGAEPFVERFKRGDAHAVIGVAPVKNPQQYGVAELDGQDRLVSIVEKPAEPKTNLAVVGVYLFDESIHRIVKNLAPSARGELEITDAIRSLHETDGSVRVVRLEGWWKDTGRQEDLLEANERVLASRPRAEFSLRGTVDPGAHVSGSVDLGERSHVGAGCGVRGPAVIGRDVRIDDGAYIGPYTAIGDRAVVRRAEVDRSILMEGAEVDAPIRVVDSIIGRGARVLSRSRLPSGQSFTLGDSCQVLL